MRGDKNMSTIHRTEHRKIAIVADDNTGATDAAGMLTSCGASALLILDPKMVEQEKAPGDYDVVVVSTRIRSVEPDEAYKMTKRVIEGLSNWGFDTIQLKYCSTFDSTERGNIGQSLDAAHELLKFSSTIVCPALPVNGRRTYMGYHFVHDRLLSESPLSRHPLNPMTDSFLPRWLGYQTEKAVGRIDVHTIRRGVEAVREARKKLEEEGAVYHVTDALEQSDIDRTVQAYGDTPFLSGGSGISQAFGNLYYAEAEPKDFTEKLKKRAPGLVVISGSESPTTKGQLDYAINHGFASVKAHPLDILKETSTPEANASISKKAEEIATHYREGRSVVLSLDRERGGEVAEVNREAEKLDLSPVDVGNIIGSFMGRVAARLVHEEKIERLLISGGETSGSVCFECGFRALEVGLPIDPGVPFCFPVDISSKEADTKPSAPLLVLKSGNFGGEDLYTRTAVFGVTGGTG